MLINEDDDKEAAAGGASSRMEEDVEGRAYQDQLTSTEGMTRGRGGKVIFNKDTKRGRATEAEGDVSVSANSLTCSHALSLVGPNAHPRWTVLFSTDGRRHFRAQEGQEGEAGQDQGRRRIQGKGQ